MHTWEKIPGSPRFSTLQVMESWNGPGNVLSSSHPLVLTSSPHTLTSSHSILTLAFHISPLTLTPSFLTSHTLSPSCSHILTSHTLTPSHSHPHLTPLHPHTRIPHLLLILSPLTLTSSYLTPSHPPEREQTSEEGDQSGRVHTRWPHSTKPTVCTSRSSELITMVTLPRLLADLSWSIQNHFQLEMFQLIYTVIKSCSNRNLDIWFWLENISSYYVMYEYSLPSSPSPPPPPTWWLFNSPIVAEYSQ